MALEHIGAVIGILTFVGGILAWYRGAIEKDYASKRDWGHVKRNQEQLVENLVNLTKDQDQRFDQINNQLLELKGMFYAAMGRHKPD